MATITKIPNNVQSSGKNNNIQYMTRLTSSEQGERSLTGLWGTPEPSWCAAQTQPWTPWSLDMEPEAERTPTAQWLIHCVNHKGYEQVSKSLSQHQDQHKNWMKVIQWKANSIIKAKPSYTRTLPTTKCLVPTTTNSTAKKYK